MKNLLVFTFLAVFHVQVNCAVMETANEEVPKTEIRQGDKYLNPADATIFAAGATAAAARDALLAAVTTAHTISVSQGQLSKDMLELSQTVAGMIEQTEKLVQESLKSNDVDLQKSADLAGKVAGEAMVLGKATSTMAHAAQLAASLDRSAVYPAQVTRYTAGVVTEAAREVFTSFAALKAAAELTKFEYTPMMKTKPNPENRFLKDLYVIGYPPHANSFKKENEFSPIVGAAPVESEDFKCAEFCHGNDCKFMCKTCSRSGFQNCSN